MYELDLAKFFSTPGLAGQTLLKKHFLTDINIINGRKCHSVY